MRSVVALIVLVGALADSSASSSSFRQLYSGFDGPRESKSFRFDSADAVRASWVASAIPGQLEEILSRVDFTRDVLIAAAVGMRDDVNAPAKVVEVDELVVYLEIGVNTADCTEPIRLSYPFVLVSVPRPKLPIPSEGFDHKGYENGCRPEMSGVPHDPGS
jgi:hypothetical protein